MPVTVKTPSDIEADFGFGDDGFHRGCNWDKSPCGQTPEYYLSYRCTHPQHDDHATEIELYCPRHYALTLLRIQEVDLVLNSQTFQKYVWEYGPIKY
ncbi:hypothetical protein [uncultured Brevibacterium sp.]|uniref:hypothetical protein n=1 Tax=uncultured Brevibacterium sp. TaxID=189678 RepID=UPI0025D883E8|nr:hypothetical protein [uncultured Brevibacterium sp.]